MLGALVGPSRSNNIKEEYCDSILYLLSLLCYSFNYCIPLLIHILQKTIYTPGLSSA